MEAKNNQTTTNVYVTWLRIPSSDTYISPLPCLWAETFQQRACVCQILVLWMRKEGTGGVCMYFQWDPDEAVPSWPNRIKYWQMNWPRMRWSLRDVREAEVLMWHGHEVLGPGNKLQKSLLLGFPRNPSFWYKDVGWTYWLWQGMADMMGLKLAKYDTSNPMLFLFFLPWELSNVTTASENNLPAISGGLFTWHPQVSISFLIQMKPWGNCQTEPLNIEVHCYKRKDKSKAAHKNWWVLAVSTGNNQEVAPALLI